MTKTKRKKIYFGAFWVVLVGSFLFFATILVAYANGYHFNLKNMHLQKTGMIVVSGPTVAPTIIINGTEKIANLPKKFGGLVPGRYEIKLVKTNYHDWSKVVSVTGGQAISLDNVTLFLKNAVTNQVPTNQQTLDNINNNHKSQNADLRIQNNEIFYQNQLITRFSQNISGAIYDSSTNHFYLQLDAEIRAIDFDGANSVLLFHLPKNTPVTFYVDAEKIFYILESQIFQTKVR